MTQHKNKRKATQTVLADHKQVGKTFIPPMLQIGPLEYYSWRSQVVPELIWIATLIDRFGLKRAAELCLVLARSAKSAITPGRNIWFAAASAFDLLDDVGRTAVLDQVRDKGELQSLKDAMAPLASLYPTFPLRFIYEPNDLSQDADLLKIVKALLECMYDRTGHLATFCQANAVYIAFDLDMLKVAPHLSLAKFPQIEEYPASEISLEIAGAARTTVSTFIKMHHKNHDCTWHIDFWNRGFELEGCDLD